MNELFAAMIELGASDLHVGAGHEPRLRINGELHSLTKLVTQQDIDDWLAQQLTQTQQDALIKYGDTDFSWDGPEGERFRGSAFRERGNVNLAVRLLPAAIPAMDEIEIPEVVQQWSTLDSGLILVTGPTGSGKSTTIASMVNAANQRLSKHILTIEDPVEYVLPAGQSVVHQRDLGVDTHDFPRAIRAGLREDVDIMVVGEMRDQETMAAAITVAETGHLVFATLHTSSAASAIDRIIDVFDPAQQPLVRSRLAQSLIGVVYQRLLKSTNGGRVAAFEVLVADHAIKNLIREGKTFQIPNAMLTGAVSGTTLMPRAIENLVSYNKVERQVADDFLRQSG